MIILTPVSIELNTPPLQLKIPRAVATTVCPSSSSSSSSALGLKEKELVYSNPDVIKMPMQGSEEHMGRRFT